MGSCCQPRTLSKHWPTKTQIEQQYILGPSFSSSSTLESYEEDEIIRTAEELFQRFDINKDNVMDRDELLSFMRNAYKRSKKGKKSDDQLLYDLEVIFRKMGLSGKRDYVRKDQFLMYIRELFKDNKEE